MPDEEKEPTTRVAMLWPVGLKDAVRDEVGPRGLTDFAVEAVRAKLGIHDAHKEDSRELNEVRFLAQRLADAIALAGEYEDRAETLRLMELPSWIRTDGWPKELAAIVQPEDSTPEPVSLAEEMGERPCPYWREEKQCELPSRHDGTHRVGDMEWGGPIDDLPAVGDPETIMSEKPAPKDDLAERVRQKALEKGVDLSGIDLKPASQVAKVDEEMTPEEFDRRFAEGEPVELEVGSVRAEEPTNPDACPKCGGELVAGECWECM